MSYQVESGCDGEQAVELAREGGFDLILLDLMMPKIDGLQACMRIREFSNVPIIMLTATFVRDLLQTAPKPLPDSSPRPIWCG